MPVTGKKARKSRSYVHAKRVPYAKGGSNRPYPYVHQKKNLKEESYRQYVAQKLATMPKSSRIDPKDVPDTFLDIPCVMTEFKVPPLEERQQTRTDFESGIRADFIKHLAKNHYKELRAAGITDKQINGMKYGYTPNGFNTHHKVPIHGGGTNDFSNLMLIKRIPYHDMLHNQVINPQIRGIEEGESIMIKIPMTDAKVFVPDPRFKEMQKEAERVAAEKRRQNQEKKKAKAKADAAKANKNKGGKKTPTVKKKTLYDVMKKGKSYADILIRKNWFGR